MAKQQISVPLYEKQAAYIRRRADEEGRSAASVIRRLQARVANQLEQRPAA
jgi:hypothetical protein